MAFYHNPFGAVTSVPTLHDSHAEVTPVVVVTQSDLEFVADRSPTARSPYHGVYFEKGGWVAKAYKRRVGKVQPTPREAAKVLVGWWKARYGDRWRAVWGLRRTKGWVPLRAGDGGVWARVELAGEGVVLLGQAGGVACRAAERAGCRPFPTAAEAGRGVAAWAWGVWGAGWPAAVRRTSAAQLGPTRRPVGVGRDA